VGYGSSFADDELADAAETAHTLGSGTRGRITRSTFEDTLPRDRRVAGGADRLVVDRADVFRLCPRPA